MFGSKTYKADERMYMIGWIVDQADETMCMIGCW